MEISPRLPVGRIQLKRAGPHFFKKYEKKYLSTSSPGRYWSNTANLPPTDTVHNFVDSDNASTKQVTSSFRPMSQEAHVRLIDV